MFAKITINPEIIYKTHIVGVSIVVTFAILLIPPTTTIPISIAATRPITHVKPWKILFSPPVINTIW